MASFSSSRKLGSLATAGLVSLLGFSRLASANCECGYTAVIDNTTYLFTDLIESNFAHSTNISYNTDWARQQFNVSAEANRGEFGESFDVANIEINPATDNSTEFGNGADGKAAGLELIVKSEQVDGYLPVSEIDSNRQDILYGTFRASMKVTDVGGTCSAFFWYYNNTQEIDMEFLSQEFNATNSSYPVNLVLQSREAAENGYDAAKTGNFLKTNLPFDPTADFHEYRIDFLPDVVYFYADNELLGTMNGSAVPTHPGHLVLQHWSNGNAAWSGGPPSEDAVTTVAYVKAYFNSSSTQRQTDWSTRCKDINAVNATCTVPELSSDNTSSTGWFFSGQTNMTNNQTVSGQEDSAGVRQAPGMMVWSVMAIAFFVATWAL